MEECLVGGISTLRETAADPIISLILTRMIDISSVLRKVNQTVLLQKAAYLQT